MIIFKEMKELEIEKLKDLYEDAGWFAYTKDLVLLQQAVEHSLYVLSAWDKDQLVGLVRVVGDGLTIIYIQDILVSTEYQNRGIASELLQRVLEKYASVRQKVLLTEEAPNVRHFYEKNGFTSCDKGDLVAFVKF